MYTGDIDGVLKNFVKFAGKYLQAETCKFIEKETVAQVFFYKFREIFHLWETASETWNISSVAIYS